MNIMKNLNITFSFVFCFSSFPGPRWCVGLSACSSFLLCVAPAFPACRVLFVSVLFCLVPLCCPQVGCGGVVSCLPFGLNKTSAVQKKLQHFSQIQIANFSSLTTLDLSENQFYNSFIPSWVFGLTHLDFLGLSLAELERPIPNCLCLSQSNMYFVFGAYL